MTFTFLGTGTSQGVPVIGCQCNVCLSKDEKDQRLRTSGLIQLGDEDLLIDMGPDFRQQALRANLKKLNAVVLTHEHADHTAGLDDIRPINFKMGSIPFYGLPRVLDDLKKRFHYVFEEHQYPGLPEVSLNKIFPGQHISIGQQKIEFIPVIHGKLEIIGVRIKGLVYITDASSLSESTIKSIQNCTVLVLNALHREKHHSHLNLEQALYYIDRIQPKTCYLTHISHHMGLHEEVQKELGPNIWLAYDGLQVDFSDE